jgi:hypothetical protein
MNAQQFAEQWINDWNSHELERILAHYAEDVEITTPMLQLALGDPRGTLKGKAFIADYWQKALEKLPDLHFELYAVTQGINSVALYYKSVMNRNAIEVMFFDAEEKVNKMVAHYAEIKE